MIGVRISGEELMRTLDPGERINADIMECFALLGNSAILMDGKLYVSKSALVLLHDPESYEDAFKGLLISV